MVGRHLGHVKSNLSDRLQRLDINGTWSSGSAISIGVPQGSIVGIFLVFSLS